MRAKISMADTTACSREGADFSFFGLGLGRRSVTPPRDLGNGKTGRDSFLSHGARDPCSEARDCRTQRTIMFLDEFEFVKRLGEGAFATVWAARRKDPGGPNHGKLYAVKHLKQADDGAAGKGLLGTPEFRSLKFIARHPNVLRAVQVARERGQVFLVTEWCDDNLLSIVETARERGLGRVPEDVTRAALSHLLEALAHCHDARWVHRDVKPENILVASGVAKLADFGEACEFDGDDALRTYVGTRWYRAPEQFVFEKHAPNEYRVINARWRNPGAADVWAAGCVMCECYLGHALFRGNSSADMLRKMADVLGDGGGFDDANQSSKKLIREWPIAANDDACVPRGPCRLADAFGRDGIGADALDLVRAMLAVDPARRITARAALAHPFFSSREKAAAGAVVLPSSRMGAVRRDGSSSGRRVERGRRHARTFQKTDDDDDAERRRSADPRRGAGGGSPRTTATPFDFSPDGRHSRRSASFDRGAARSDTNRRGGSPRGCHPGDADARGCRGDGRHSQGALASGSVGRPSPAAPPANRRGDAEGGRAWPASDSTPRARRDPERNPRTRRHPHAPTVRSRPSTASRTEEELARRLGLGR